MRKVLTAVLILIAQPAVSFAEDADPAPASAPEPTEVQPDSESEGGELKTAKVNATQEELQQTGGVHYGVSLIHSVGQGTFEGFRVPQNAAMLTDVGGALRLSAMYGFQLAGVKLSATAMGNVSMEYSLPDNATARRFDWGDIRLGLAAPAIFTEKVSGISLIPSISLNLPISFASRWQNMVTSGSVGLAFVRSFGSQVQASLSVGASKGFFAGNPGLTPEQAREVVDAQQNQLFLCRSGDVHCIGGLQSLYSVSGGLGVNYRPMEKLSLGLGLGLSKSVKPWQPIDDQSSKKVDEFGNPVVRNQGSNDLMTGSLEASYALTDNVALGLDMSTAQAPKFNDNKSFAFPFFAFGRQENSATSYSLTVSAQY